jgi:AraC-like DNA-binding protein
MDALLKLNAASFPVAVIEHYKKGPSAIFDAHAHARKFQLFYFTQGEASVKCGARDYFLKQGDILLLNCNETHAGSCLSEELRYYVFRIDIQLMADYGIEAVNDKYLFPLAGGAVFFFNRISDSAVETVLKAIMRISMEKPCGYEMLLLARVYEVLSILYSRHVKFSYAQPDAELLMAKTKRFSNIISYLDAHYAQRISVEKAAEMAGMSVGYFCRTFKKAFGVTFTDYINRVRVEKAAALLMQGVGNITDAAMSVGYDDANYFSRVFKKYMKMPPSEFVRNDARFFM